MKKLVVILMFFYGALSLASAQEIKPPSEGKAVVYFTRISSMGMLINFSYFDKDKFIGKFNGPKYLRYECEPGEHLFWATSENRDFVVAELEAGKIYFIEAVPKMGGIKSGVQLVPVDPKDPKKMAKIEKLLNKKPSESFSASELESETKLIKEKIDKGLAKYQEETAQGKKAARLDKTMFYEKSAGS
jgi:hypothetical protein